MMTAWEPRNVLVTITVLATAVKTAILALTIVIPGKVEHAALASKENATVYVIQKKKGRIARIARLLIAAVWIPVNRISVVRIAALLLPIAGTEILTRAKNAMTEEKVQRAMMTVHFLRAEMATSIRL